MLLVVTKSEPFVRSFYRSVGRSVEAIGKLFSLTS